MACDPSLEPLDIRVYCMLAGSVWQGATARIGTRLIARGTLAAATHRIGQLQNKAHGWRGACQNRHPGMGLLCQCIFALSRSAYSMGLAEMQCAACDRIFYVKSSGFGWSL